MSEYNNAYSKSINTTFNDYLSKVFSKVAIGLGISAITAFVSSLFYEKMVMALGVNYIFVILGLVALELIVAIVFSVNLMKYSKSTCWALYLIYSVLTGLSLSCIFVEYTTASVWASFGVTMIMFVCMSIIGNKTNANLTKFSGYVAPALIAIIVASLLNVFLFKSSMISWIVTYAGIVIFLIIVAMDVQKLRGYYNAAISDEQIGGKLMIMGAFQLYLDFINIFIRILSIFGKKKK